MVRLEGKSRLRPPAVLERAEEFFGPMGLGLRVTARGADSLTLEGGGGGVSITAQPDGGGSTVEIVSREWDTQADRFLETVT